MSISPSVIPPLPAFATFQKAHANSDMSSPFVFIHLSLKTGERKLTRPIASKRPVTLVAWLASRHASRYRKELHKSHYTASRPLLSPTLHLENLPFSKQLSIKADILFVLPHRRWRCWKQCPAPRYFLSARKDVRFNQDMYKVICWGVEVDYKPNPPPPLSSFFSRHHVPNYFSLSRSSTAKNHVPPSFGERRSWTNFHPLSPAPKRMCQRIHINISEQCLVMSYSTRDAYHLVRAN